MIRCGAKMTAGTSDSKLFGLAEVAYLQKAVNETKYG